jgi:hypothetical protein
MGLGRPSSFDGGYAGDERAIVIAVGGSELDKVGFLFGL